MFFFLLFTLRNGKARCTATRSPNEAGGAKMFAAKTKTKTGASQIVRVSATSRTASRHRLDGLSAGKLLGVFSTWANFWRTFCIQSTFTRRSNPGSTRQQNHLLESTCSCTRGSRRCTLFTFAFRTQWLLDTMGPYSSQVNTRGVQIHNANFLSSKKASSPSLACVEATEVVVSHKTDSPTNSIDKESHFHTLSLHTVLQCVLQVLRNLTVNGDSETHRHKTHKRQMSWKVETSNCSWNWKVYQNLKHNEHAQAVTSIRHERGWRSIKYSSKTCLYFESQAEGGRRRNTTMQNPEQNQN